MGKSKIREEEIEEIVEKIRSYVPEQKSGRIDDIVSYLNGFGYTLSKVALRRIVRNELERMQEKGLVRLEKEYFESVG
jgi:Mn-dependent DtxR family transcriptional regulator